MGETARIAERHRSGSVGRILGQGCSNSPKGPKGDYVRNNVVALRDMQRQLREQRKEAARPAAPVFKLRQFENIPSRVLATPERRGLSVHSTSSPMTASTFCTPEKNSCGGGGGSARTERRRAQSCGNLVSVDTPPKMETERRRQPEPPPSPAPAWWDAVTGTGTSAPPAAHPSRLCEKAQIRAKAAKGAGKSGGGKENSNVRQRCARALNAEMGEAGTAAEDCSSTRPAPPPEAVRDVPLGYRVVPEDERLETLAALNTKLRDLDGAYSRLPLYIDTEGGRRQQRALREKIAETEEAVKLFARPKVFVEN